MVPKLTRQRGQSERESSLQLNHVAELTAAEIMFFTKVYIYMAEWAAVQIKF